MRRRRSTSTVLAAALAAGALAVPLGAGTAHAADVLWTNAQGGAWNDPANWSTNQVPTFEDRALITLAGTYVVDVASTDQLVVGEVVLGGPGSTPTLHIAPAGSVSIEAGFEIRAGTLLQLEAESFFLGNGAGRIAGRVEGDRAVLGADGIWIEATGELILVEMSLSTRIVNDGFLHAEGMCSMGAVVNGAGATLESRTGPGLFPGAFMDSLVNAGHASFGPGTQAVAGALFANEPGGVIEIAGATTANAETFRNAGVWRLAAGVTLSGLNYEQLATGELAPSYAAGSVVYAVLCQNVVLDGTLAPVFDAAFTPPPGNLPLIFKESIAGQFSIVSPAGTHGVAIDAAYLDQVYVKVLGPGIAITPPGGGDVGPVSAIITGSDLTSVTAVRLTRAGQSAIFAEPYARDPKTRTIYATFDLTGRALGAWNVEVEGPGGSEIAPDAFTIASAIAYRQPIRVDWMGRNVMRLGGTAEWMLAILNPNDTNERGAVQIEVPSGLIWELNAPAPGDVKARRIAGQSNQTTKLVVRDVLAPPGITTTAIKIKLTLPADSPAGRGILQARWYTP